MRKHGFVDAPALMARYDAMPAFLAAEPLVQIPGYLGNVTVSVVTILPHFGEIPRESIPVA
jgi:hypothetical protein